MNNSTNDALANTLNEIHYKETIVFQQRNFYSQNNHHSHTEKKVLEAPSFYPGYYTFDSMLQVQNIFNTLHFLETIKYSPNYVNIRSLLHKYLYSKYDIVSCNLLASSKVDLKTIKTLQPEDKITSNTKMLTIDGMTTKPSPSQSIRNYINNFITDIKNDNNPTRSWRIFCKTDNNSTQKSTKSTRHYLPAINIICFLLMFTYYDGRDFTSRDFQLNPDNIYLPRHNKDDRFTENSYRLVMQKVEEIYNIFRRNPKHPSVLTLDTVAQCDRLFLNLKSRCLQRQYDYYQSNDLLDYLIKNYKLTAKEANDLKEFLIKEIFKDKNYITRGYKSSLPDFMLPFNIFFHFDILSVNYDNNSFEKLKKSVKSAKDATKNLLNSDIRKLLFSPSPLLVFTKNGFVDWRSESYR